MARSLRVKENFFFFFLVFIRYPGYILIITLKLGVKNGRWNVVAFPFSSSSPFMSSHCQDGSIHLDAKAVLNEGSLHLPQSSLQFNYGALAGLISIPQSRSSLSDR